mgnify:CR=1 FL=1
MSSVFLVFLLMPSALWAADLKLAFRSTVPLDGTVLFRIMSIWTRVAGRQVSTAPSTPLNGRPER